MVNSDVLGVIFNFSDLAKCKSQFCQRAALSMADIIIKKCLVTVQMFNGNFKTVIVILIWCFLLIRK